MAVTKQCPGCGSSVNGERFCGSCGSAIPQFHHDFAAPSQPTTAKTATGAGLVSTVQAPRSPSSQGATRPTAAPPVATVARSSESRSGARCEVCGNGPAIDVTFHQGIGMLMARKVATSSGFMCRDCGRGVGRRALNRTLWTGWWGVVSFFANVAYIFGNAAALVRLGQVAPPSKSSIHAPLDPGRSVFARSGLWFVIIGVLILIGNASQSNDDYSSYAPASPPVVAPMHDASSV